MWMLPYWGEKKNLPKNKECFTHTEEYAGVLVSADQGDTWDTYGGLQAKGTHLIEGSVVEAGGKLMMMFRTGLGVHYRSYSTTPAGNNWSPATPTRVNNPDSKSHMIRLQPQGEVIIAHNNHKDCCDAGCRKCRTRLVISRSRDGGHKFAPLHMIVSHRTTFLRTHYPTLLQVGCRLLVAYSSAYSCCAPEKAELGIRVVSYQMKE
mmetsp:Transcript_17991/g.58255  ORF Transcript_17991/g.58255 Transcript_17991/m.58255 type:complete len:206 (+) Transcript_17991:201-818(+)